MFNIENVIKKFSVGGNEILVLNKVSLSLDNGGFLAVVGPSGSGKSTLLYTLGGLLTPNEGSVEIDGINVYELSHRERSKFRRENIGFVFQTYELLPYLTAIENVMLPLSLSGVNSSEQSELALKCLERVGLAHRADHKPSQLSGGEQQRVAIARGIINNPTLLLADEPTGNLDQKIGGEIITLLNELRKDGLTIVLVTHDKTKTEYADSIVTMVDGRIENILKR
jgi:putative ABC transport system ATP-binding protein